MTRLTKIAATVALLALGACSDESGARQTLIGAGMTDIKITGWAPLACGQDDTFSTGFKAKGPTGRPVSGVVCSGFLFKGATVRFY